MEQLVSTLQELDRDDEVRCIVLGGNDKAFAAGADIGELARSSAIDLYYQRRIERWDAIRALWTPLVAAVSGYCLGGGCELALACDLIVASESAKFGQPETGVGVIPGAGGTQRLTRAVGKALAMDVILSGRFLSADEALAAGLVARVVPDGEWLDEAKGVAQEIASKAPIATRLAKEARRPGVRGAAPARPRVRAAAALPGVRLGGREGRPDTRSWRSASPSSKRALMAEVETQPRRRGADDHAQPPRRAERVQRARCTRRCARRCKRPKTPAVRAVVLTGAGRGFCVGPGPDRVPRGRAATSASRLRSNYHPNVLAIRRAREAGDRGGQRRRRRRGPLARLRVRPPHRRRHGELRARLHRHRARPRLGRHVLHRPAARHAARVRVDDSEPQARRRPRHTRGGSSRRSSRRTRCRAAPPRSPPSYAARADARRSG